MHLRSLKAVALAASFAFVGIHSADARGHTGAIFRNIGDGMNLYSLPHPGFPNHGTLQRDSGGFAVWVGEYPTFLQSVITAGQNNSTVSIGGGFSVEVGLDVDGVQQASITRDSDGAVAWQGAYDPLLATAEVVGGVCTE